MLNSQRMNTLHNSFIKYIVVSLTNQEKDKYENKTNKKITAKVKKTLKTLKKESEAPRMYFLGKCIHMINIAKMVILCCEWPLVHFLASQTLKIITQKLCYLNHCLCKYLGVLLVSSYVFG